MTNTVITIARQYGSGGRDIGRAVAERLGIPCLDQNIPRPCGKAALAEELIEKSRRKSNQQLGLFHDDGQLFFWLPTRLHQSASYQRSNFFSGVRCH